MYSTIVPRRHPDGQIDKIFLIKTTRVFGMLLAKLDIKKGLTYYQTSGNSPYVPVGHKIYGLGLKDSKEFVERLMEKNVW